jgi:hypothetical protein
VSDDFELSNGEIRVRGTKGGIYPIKVPDGLSDLAFRTTIAGIYTFFIDKGMLPTVDDLYQRYPQYPKKTYAIAFTTPELREALAYRGISWTEDTGLSLEQQSVLMILSNPADRRTLANKLRVLGVPMPRYQAWLKQALFAQHLNKQTKLAYEEFLPNMRTALIGNAVDGDQKAIEMVFAMTGEWNPNALAVQDSKAVVMAVIEAVIKRVEDKAIRESIMEDVQSALLAYNISNVRSLEA